MADNISKHNAALTPEERSERGRKAGTRSGEIRRENRRLKDAIIDRMSDDDLGEIIDNLIRRAKRNTRDFEVLRDTIGQKPKEDIVLDREPIVVRIHSKAEAGDD